MTHIAKATVPTATTNYQRQADMTFIPRIVKGNDFTLRIPTTAYWAEDGSLREGSFPLEEVTDLSVTFESESGRTYSPSWHSEGNTVMADVEGRHLTCGYWAVRITGTYRGQKIRSYAERAFEIVHSNELANIAPADDHTYESELMAILATPLLGIGDTAGRNEILQAIAALTVSLQTYLGQLSFYNSIAEAGNGKYTFSGQNVPDKTITVKEPDVTSESFSGLERQLEKKVDVSYFEQLFKLYNATSPIRTNATLPQDTSRLNIRTMYGLWTDYYLSAIGKNDGSDGEGGEQQEPVQAWGGLDEQLLWKVLGTSGSDQIDSSHLADALADYVRKEDLRKENFFEEFTDAYGRVSVKLKESYAGLWTAGYVSALGQEDENGSVDDDYDEEMLWAILGNTDTTRQISREHLTDALSGYMKTSQMPTVPTNLSDFVNDMGFIDENGSCAYSQQSGYAEQAATVPWKGVTDTIRYLNEFNFVHDDVAVSMNRIWLNYHTTEGHDTAAVINEYHFGNGRGSRSGVSLYADNMYADGAMACLSDMREKEIKGNITLSLEDIAEAPLIRYLWKGRRDDGLQAGSSAQYWQAVVEETVHTRGDGRLTLSYGVTALIAAVTTARHVRDHEKRLRRIEKQLKTA